MKNEPVISYQALGRIVVVGIGIYLARIGIPVIITILIALIISAALHPAAVWLHSKKVPWLMSVALVVLLLLIPLIAVIVTATVLVVQQFPQLVQFFNGALSHLPFVPEMVKSFDPLPYIQNNADLLWSSTRAIVLGVASVLTVVFLSFYFIYDKVNLIELFLGLIPSQKRKRVRAFFGEISEVVGQYIRANLIISVICMVIIFVGLTIMGVPFALPIAIFTGILDLLPMIGPVLAALPALVIGFGVSPLTCLAVLMLYVVYQEVENLFIVPLMYNKALNLSPALVFLSVVVGAGLFGVLGAFLSLPVAASIPVIIKYLHPATIKDKESESKA